MSTVNAKNVYFENLAPLFEKAAQLNAPELWGSLSDALVKIAPEPAQKEKLKAIRECFDMLFKRVDMPSVIFLGLSYLINVTGDIKYYGRLLDMACGAAAPKSAKHALYNYTRGLANKFPYFEVEYINTKQTVLFNECIALHKRFLQRDLNAFAAVLANKTVLIIADDFAAPPFYMLNNIKTPINEYVNLGYKVTVILTAELAHSHPEVRLFGQAPQNTSHAVYVKKMLGKLENVSVYELKTEASYVNAVRTALNIIKKNGAPEVVINCAGENIFAALLREFYIVKDVNNDTAEYYKTRAVKEEQAGSIKNAVYLRKKLYSINPGEHDNNEVLFRLCIEEGLYTDAERLYEYFTQKGQLNETLNQLCFSFRYLTYGEKDAFVFAEECIRQTENKPHFSEFYTNALLNILSAAQYTDAYTNEELFVFAQKHYNALKPRNENRFLGYKHKKANIRIGFVTEVLARHPVGYFVSPLFKEKTPNSLFEYYFYYTGKPAFDDLQELIKKNADCYREIENKSAISKTILKDKLDILIDLSGISEQCIARILVERLAPVQMTWIGFPCTLPIKNVDYNITDKKADPEGTAQTHYTEKLLYIPDTFLCYGVNPECEVTPPPLVKNGYITFGSFNTGLKYTDFIISIWARILNTLKDARLVVRTPDADNEDLRQRLYNKFINKGIPKERFSLMGKTSLAEYFAAYNEVDIILDTYPFNGATTTCDAFLMSTPVISLYGSRHVSRVGLSMLTTAGFGFLAAGTEDEYVNIALSLAEDKQRIIKLKKTIRENALLSPLFDAAVFKRNFEEAVYDAYINT